MVLGGVAGLVLLVLGASLLAHVLNTSDANAVLKAMIAFGLLARSGLVAPLGAAASSPPRVDDRRIISDIVHRLRWCDRERVR